MVNRRGGATWIIHASWLDFLHVLDTLDCAIELAQINRIIASGIG